MIKTQFWKVQLSSSFAMLAACAFFCSTAHAQQTGYSGTAFGTLVSVSPGVSNLNSGETAPSTLCTETTGITNSNSAAAVSLPPLVTTGVIDTSVSSAAVSNGTAATAVAAVSNVNLLGGLITADELNAVSSSISGPGGFSTSSSGTVFTNAKVLGIPIAVNVSPNTRIVLPGIGFVVLNEQITQVFTTAISLTINMVHVKVTQNNSLGLPVGAQIVVAHAQSSTLFNAGLLRGSAYGSSVSAGPVQSGPSAAITLPCDGTTGGNVMSNDIAGVDVPGILATGAIHTTAQGTVAPTSASGETTASTSGINLLANLVTATAVRADAHASTNGSTVSVSDTGSIFTGLVVAGHPEVGANPAPNTKVTISGLGTLWLHRVIQTSTSEEVRMVELVVDTSNSLGLPVGADIRISVAKVGIVTQ